MQCCMYIFISINKYTHSYFLTALALAECPATGSPHYEFVQDEQWHRVGMGASLLVDGALKDIFGDP